MEGEGEILLELLRELGAHNLFDESLTDFVENEKFSCVAHFGHFSCYCLGRDLDWDEVAYNTSIGNTVEFDLVDELLGW